MLISGDIINIHAKGFNFLRLITGLYYNHTIMIDDKIQDDYGILESIDKGTAANLLSNYQGQEVAIYRYKGITSDQQESLRKNARKMGAYHYDFLIPFRVIKRVGIRKSIKLIIQLLNKEYPLEIPHISDSHVVCSEMVQQAYEMAGIPLEENGWLLTPDGIGKSDKLEKIYEGTL